MYAIQIHETSGALYLSWLFVVRQNETAFLLPVRVFFFHCWLKSRKKQKTVNKFIQCGVHVHKHHDVGEAISILLLFVIAFA